MIGDQSSVCQASQPQHDYNMLLSAVDIYSFCFWLNMSKMKGGKNGGGVGGGEEKKHKHNLNSEIILQNNPFHFACTHHRDK